MSDVEFNLTEEPWIRVALSDGRTEEVSLCEALRNAHEYKSLAGEMAAQNIAVLRMMVALIHTVYSRTEVTGTKLLVDSAELAINLWRNIWANGRFPEKQLCEYLNVWRDRFWLFHPERPFYQVPSASIGTKNSAVKLNGAVSESNNKARLFSQLSGTGKESMSYAEAARWLIFLNGFDDCAAKQADKSNGSRGSTVGWLGKLGLVCAIGSTLFETIMLNMPMLYGKDEDLWKEDVPTWELEKARSSERETIEMPDNLAGLYTLQSRRIILSKQNEGVTGYSLLGGDTFDDVNALNEPMTLWKTVVDKETKNQFYKPLQHIRERYIWRDFSAFSAPSESDVKPGVVAWCNRLRREGIISSKRLLIFETVCIRYDSSQSSSITDSFADSIAFHADVLSEAGKYWRDEIQNQIAKADDAAKCIGNLIKDIRRANGLDPDKDSAPVNEAKQSLYHQIDRIFRDWLARLDADQDAEERNVLVLELEDQVRKCSLMLGNNIIARANESAFIGRTINKRHYSTPEAYKRFKSSIWKLYQYKKGDDLGEQRF